MRKFTTISVLSVVSRHCSSTTIVPPTGDIRTHQSVEKQDTLRQMRVKADTFNQLKPEHTANFKDMRPAPTDKESDDDLRRRLIFQSRYRGMVEMDVIFGLFAKTRLPQMDRAGLIEYDTMLRQLDNDLFNWIVMGFEAPAEIKSLGLFKDIQKFMVEHKDEIVAERL
eukprot:GILI01034450.1.p1 GENE.GILI01034450.1~~GILI01034450.1.p1  ORF type:complete len:178 (-),score=23.41 GILI01034450.1:62-565(-)